MGGGLSLNIFAFPLNQCTFPWFGGRLLTTKTETFTAIHCLENNRMLFFFFLL